MWSDWGSWNCDKNTGQQRRARQCDNPLPRNDGLSCSGNGREEIACKGNIGMKELLKRYLFWHS